MNTYEQGMARLQAILDAPVPRRAPTAEHLMVKARTITADRGEFEAVVSTENVDREKDIVRADAMVTALRRWAEHDKLIPLCWSHSVEASDVIGHVRPESAKAVNGEVHVEGWVNQTTPRGRDAWRLVKSDTLSFSFGYMIAKSTKRDDGVRLIEELDVFEISACVAPANADTRVTSWKSVDRDDDEAPSLEDLAALERDLGLRDDGHEELRQRVADEFRVLMGDTAGPRHRNGGSAKSQRERAAKTAQEVGPIRVVSFRC